jgi:hypothetical protein
VVGGGGGREIKQEMKKTEGCKQKMIYKKFKYKRRTEGHHNNTG